MIEGALLGPGQHQLELVELFVEVDGTLIEAAQEDLRVLLDFRLIVVLDHHLQLAHMLLQHVVEILVRSDCDRLVPLGRLRLAWHDF